MKGWYDPEERLTLPDDAHGIWRKFEGGPFADRHVLVRSTDSEALVWVARDERGRLLVRCAPVRPELPVLSRLLGAYLWDENVETLAWRVPPQLEPRHYGVGEAEQAAP